MIEIYTDGSCKGNPGPGGFAVIILKDNIIDYSFTEQSEYTTNNQMELKAIIHALKYIKKQYKTEQCVIYSDSTYCVNICNDWIYEWASKNWKNSKNEEIKNIELIQELYKLLKVEFPNFSIEKCHGHANIIGNELADAAATQNAKKFFKIKNENDIKFKYEIII